MEQFFDKEKAEYLAGVELDEARKMFERALAIDRARYGAAHLQVATRLNSLAGLLREIGDHTKAREHLETAVEIGEDAFGPNHPQVGMWLNNLGLARLVGRC